MRNFLIANSYTINKIDALDKGQLCMYDLSNGVPDQTKLPVKAGLMVVGNTEGNRVLPIYNNKLSYVVSIYQAPETFSQTVTVVSQGIGDYTLIVAKKGVGFNERNKWTSTVHVFNEDETEATIAQKLAKSINNNSVSSGVKATVNAAVITITAIKAGVDYALVPADYLTASTLGTAKAGTCGQNTVEHIKDLHAKAAADMGFNDTQQFTELLYKGYEIDPLAGTPATDYGFDVVTIKFAEPRETRTVDQDVNQIIQVAFPRVSEDNEDEVGAAAQSFVAKLDLMVGETTIDPES
jgi:hypothetical protein